MRCLLCIFSHSKYSKKSIALCFLMVCPATFTKQGMFLLTMDATSKKLNTFNCSNQNQKNLSLFILTHRFTELNGLLNKVHCCKLQMSFFWSLTVLAYAKINIGGKQYSVYSNSSLDQSFRMESGHVTQITSMYCYRFSWRCN